MQVIKFGVFVPVFLTCAAFVVIAIGLIKVLMWLTKPPQKPQPIDFPKTPVQGILLAILCWATVGLSATGMMWALIKADTFLNSF